MKYLIFFVLIFLGTCVNYPCSAGIINEHISSELSFSAQTPISFFNAVPTKIKTTDRIDLSFAVNNEIVSRYRYKIEVPDITLSSINKTLLSWSAWINNAFTDIIILKITQEGRHKLVIEYKSFGTTETKMFEKQFDVYNSANAAVRKTPAMNEPKIGNKSTESTSKNSAFEVEEIIKPDYEKLLDEAIKTNNEVLFKESVLNGAGNNLKGVNGGNIFHMMNDKLANEELISKLETNGISINETDNYGNTPLHIAIMSRDRKYARSLMNQGANLNLKNKVELTPLHLAAILNDAEAANDLFGKGAEINIMGNTGYTPLHIASLMNNIEVAKILLSLGAKTNIKTAQKLNAMTIAKIQNNDLMKKLIAKNGSYNLNNPEKSYNVNISQMNSAKLSPQFDINLPYNKDLVKKRQFNKVAGIISIPIFAICTAGAIYFRTEADNYYSLYKNAETLELAEHYYDMTRQYDTYTYISGGVSLVSAFEIVYSAIRKKNISNKMSKTLY
jgi:ankyrin repeat protein